MRLAYILSSVLWLLTFATYGADDWPMSGGTAGRTCAVAGKLPAQPQLHWTRELPPQQTAWKDEESLKFDRSYEPVIAGGLVLIASTVDDSLTAYDLETGVERWRFFTGGPVRFAPAVWKSNVLVGSDDGLLYCLDLADGKLRWSFRGGPSDRRLVGNERVISTWPVRGGPAAADGVVYFAAGVWPFMGTFIYALDIETGKEIWHNDATSFTFRLLPHPGAMGFSGLSAQGYVAVTDTRVIVPGSRSSPAVLDRKTGEFLGYGEGSGTRVRAQGDFGFAGGQVFHLASGKSVRTASRITSPVLAADRWYAPEGTFDPPSLKLSEASTVELRVSMNKDHPDNRVEYLAAAISRAAAYGTPWLRADDRLIVGDAKGLRIIPIDASGPAKSVEAVSLPVGGAVSSVAAGGGRLVVATLDGTICCFGDGPREAKVLGLTKPRAVKANAWASDAAALLKALPSAEGYALVLGLKDGGLVEELVRQSELHVVAVDANPAKVAGLRKRLHAAGLCGTRAAAIVADPAELPFAPYLATLVTSEDSAGLTGRLKDKASADRLLQIVRPFGGILAVKGFRVQGSDVRQDSTGRASGTREDGTGGASGTRQTPIPNPQSPIPQPGEFVVDTAGAAGYTLVRRPGAPPGSAPWVGQNADAGATRCSRDRLVQAPLGVLWFGNSLSNALVLPRHGEGPVQQVAGGRIFIEGPDSLSAADAYTGRMLWTRGFSDVGRWFNVTKHQRGAHALGSNFFAVPDAVYVAHNETCQVLDPATGKTLKELKLPGGGQWFYLLVYEDVLIAGTEPQITGIGAKAKDGKPSYFLYNSPGWSKGLAAFDRHSGTKLWQRQAVEGFPHYGIAAGGGKVFHVDGGKLTALDARSGRVIWETEAAVGTKLCYVPERDLVLSGGAIRARDGTVAWEKLDPLPVAPPPPPPPPTPAPAAAGTSASGPKPAHNDGKAAAATGKTSDPDEPPAPLPPPTTFDVLWDGKWGPLAGPDWIVTQSGKAYATLNGRQRRWPDGEGNLRDWRYRRTHGCGPISGSVNLLTMRSGDAAVVDFLGNGGTANLGGFRSGCTNNLIIGDGVLTAPDYSRTCYCAYQNRSSLGLVHMPEAEFWSFGAAPRLGRVAYNFGAPGEHRGADGTLWWAEPPRFHRAYIEQPRVQIEPPGVRFDYQHSSRMLARVGSHEPGVRRDALTPGPSPEAEEGSKWVGGSACLGAKTLTVPLWGIDATRPVSVRLVFAETRHDAAGQRVFDVAVQGKPLRQGLDVFTEAGGRWRTIELTADGVAPNNGADGKPASITVTLSARQGETLISGVAIEGEPAGR